MSKTRAWIAAALAAAGALAAGAAQARTDVHWSIGINLPVHPAPVYYAPPPVYYYEQPVYYYEPPVVYRPAPVYYYHPYQPAPAYVVNGRGDGWRHHQKHWKKKHRHHGRGDD